MPLEGWAGGALTPGSSGATCHGVIVMPRGAAGPSRTLRGRVTPVPGMGAPRRTEREVVPLAPVSPRGYVCPAVSTGFGLCHALGNLLFTRRGVEQLGSSLGS